MPAAIVLIFPIGKIPAAAAADKPKSPANWRAAASPHIAAFQDAEVPASLQGRKPKFKLKHYRKNRGIDFPTRFAVSLAIPRERNAAEHGKTTDVQPRTASMTSTQTGKESAVSAAVEALRKAMIAADKSALDQLTTPELSYGHSSGRLENRVEFIEALTSGKSGFSAIDLSEQTVNVVDKVALVRHIFAGTRRNAPAGEAKVNLAILTVWLQQQEQWKLLERQAAKL
jgi:hypothetical protein